jgi:hypothetical protein
MWSVGCQQQRQLGNLGVLGMDRVPGERRVDRLDRSNHLWI